MKYQELHYFMEIILLFLNRAVIIVLFLIKITNKNMCIFSLMNKKKKLRKVSLINFWYIMFFLNGITSLFYITTINLCLIVISTPSIVNPGPVNRKIPLTIFYNNVQGLIDIISSLNRKKMYKLQAHIYKNLLDIVVLNETWLKPCILDSEILNNT